MMGRQAAPEQLFYRFSVEDHVPADHLLRKIDRPLDFGSLRSEFAALYSHTGRPSIDPDQPGYQPSEADLVSFQEELKGLLDGQM